MTHDEKKYAIWAAIGIGVAIFLWWLTSKQIASQNQAGANTVTIPYLVPQASTGASPTASTTLSNQPNIIGSSPNSTVSNFSNPFAVAANPTEAPGTWGFMPNLMVSNPTGPNNAVQFGAFNQPPGVIQQNGINPPGSNFATQSAPPNG